MELLGLEGKDLVDPFGQTFFLWKRKGEKSRTHHIPMDGVKDQRVWPLVMLAQVGALLLTGEEASNLGGDVVCECRSVDG
jgi:hypothetical protein